MTLLKCGREGKRLIASSDSKYRDLILKKYFLMSIA